MKDTEYNKDLNELKEQILKEGNTLVSKRDLLKRFDEIDKEYEGRPWNLLQILANINILIGQEPCKDAISKKALHKALYDHFHDEDAPNNITEVTLGSVRNFVKDFTSVTPIRKKGKWIEVDTNMYTCSNCSHCFTIVPEDNRIQQFRYCPNCRIEMESE